MHHRVLFLLLSSIIFCFLIILSAPVVMSAGLAHAQQSSSGKSAADMIQSLTPEQRQALDKLSPADRQAFTEAVMKNGGKLTPELLNQLKAQANMQVPSAGQPLSAQEHFAIQTEQEMRAHKAEAEKKEQQFTEKTEKIIMSRMTATVEELKLFGLGHFAPARKRILTLEEAISSGKMLTTLQKDALAGFVGPLDMVSTSVNASMPPLYILSPGDRLTINYWGDLIELTTVHLVLDERGDVIVTKAGKISARGMSLAQFQQAVQEHLQRVIGKDIKLVATLDSLMSMQIMIVGEAFRPGNYAVSAVTTFFNAIYAGGGPNEYGSLRDIKLIRRNKTIPLDFYDYLGNGDSKGDGPLQAGDTIYFGRRGKTVSIAGEVNRPAVYELKKSENLKDLITMALGIKPSGLNSKVNITSLVPNREKAVFDVDMSKDDPAADHALYDGDSVTVGKINQSVMNFVTLTGNVKVPGVYELKKGMRVADLFSEINQPWGEVYLERADIFRLDKDRKTTSIVSFHLGKALQKDPVHNLELVLWDKIVVYSKWDVKYYPEMVVTISGAVQRPGEYVRTTDMRLKDLLDLAGGVLPGVSNDIMIAKARSMGEIRTIPIKLDLLEKGDESQNVRLEDMDIVMVREHSEFIERPRWVTINGEVRFPGTYPLLRKDYRMSELIERAGGLTKIADPRGTVFLRKIENLPSPEQTSDIRALNRIMDTLNIIDAKRQAVRNTYLIAGEASASKPPVIGQGSATVVGTDVSTKEAVAISMAPSIAMATSSLTGQLFSAFAPGGAVTAEARLLAEEQLKQSTRVVINMEKAMQSHGNPDDIILMSGDTIMIPQYKGTVSVVGAVLAPVTVNLGEKRKIKNMIQLAGGYAADADEKRVLVVRTDGTIIPGEEDVMVIEGDILYVPTKVTAAEILTTTDKTISVIKYALATIAGVVVFLALIP
jgi:protein involved in polysaccharide export with SLBB domain